MKKLLIIMSILILTACGKGNNANIDITDVSNISKIDIEQELKIGEVWRVPGQWQLTVDSVELAKESTELVEKGQIVVKYTYQNLGYDDISDLSLFPSEVTSDSGEAYSVISNNITGAMYIPIGAVNTAQITMNPSGNSDKIKITFKKQTDKSVDNKNFQAIFTCPVNK